ncbi:hypothetical protein SUGI_0948440 [Cryptomeria japonica]|nr:hypothetical protein SUGI_0948440 [Cryptomeria japonica]
MGSLQKLSEEEKEEEAEEFGVKINKVTKSEEVASHTEHVEHHSKCSLNLVVKACMEASEILLNRSDEL